MIKFTLPHHHIKIRLMLSAFGIACAIGLVLILDNAANAAQVNFVNAENAYKGLEMLIIGLICGIGSAIGSWVYVPKDNEPTASTVLGRAATGFMLGGFGGLGVIEYLADHNSLQLSQMAIAGGMALIISLFGGLIVDALGALVRRKTAQIEGEEK